MIPMHTFCWALYCAAMAFSVVLFACGLVKRARKVRENKRNPVAESVINGGSVK